MKKIQPSSNIASKFLNGIVTKVNAIIDKLIVDVKVNGESVVVVNQDGEREADIDLSLGDQNVKQSPTMDNKDYRILLSKSDNDTEETDIARKNTDLKYNPSTKNLQASKINGNTVPTGTDTFAMLGDIPDLNDFIEKSDTPGLVKNDGTIDQSDYVESSDLATVATSGSYNDLTDKPTIPSGQIQSDWDQGDNTAVDYIKNKPTLATVATSGSYNDLSNKPTIPDELADLADDENHRLVTDTEKSAWDAKADVSDITSAINDLDVTGASNISAGKTIKAWSETDGKVSITTQNISITKSQISDFPTIPTVNDAKLTINQNGTLKGEFTANDSDDVTVNLTDENVKQIADTATSWRRLALVENNNTEKSSNVFKNSSFWCCTSPIGTTSTVGKSFLAVGNNTSSGTDGNSKGYLRIYGENNKRSQITINGSVTADREVYLPNKDGTIALTDDIPTKTSDLTNDSNFVSDANYVHTDNNYTSTEKSKLSGIAQNAEVNVQSDWNVTNTSSDAFIKNKPSIPTKTSDLTNDSNFVADANYVHTDVNFTSTLKSKLDGIAQNAEVNVQSDWNVTNTSSDAFIKNKPSIPTALSDLSDDATHRVVTDTQISTWNNKAGSDENVKQTDITDTSWRCLTMASDATKTETTAGVRKTVGLSMQVNKVGTASQTGQIVLAIGNSIATGNADNYRGFLDIYNNGKRSRIYSNTTDNRNMIIPNKAGTFALTTDLPTVNDKTITIQQNGTNVDSFTLNQATDKSINITDTKVTQTNDTSGTEYPVILANGSTTPDTATVRKSNGLKYKPSTGELRIQRIHTATTNADSKIFLGNSTAAGTAGASRGYIEFYAMNGVWTRLIPSEATNNRTYFLPVDKTNNAVLATVNEIPTKTSQLTNDSNFPVDASYVHTDNNYTTTEKNKLSGIAEGAEVNQNAFGKIKVGSTTTTASAKQDTLTLAAGTNTTLSISGKTVTINSSEDVKWTENNYLGAKNLFSYPYQHTTKTDKSVTFTDNLDGSITVNGTASADVTFYCHVRGNKTWQLLLPAGGYTLTGCPSGGSSSTYSLYCNTYKQGTTTAGSGIRDNGSGGTTNYADAISMGCYIDIKSGTVCNNLVFKPMLRLSSIADSTYEPYSKTNLELTEDSVDWNNLGNNFGGFKNMIKYPWYHQYGRVNRGITFTYDEEGYIALNGTGDASNQPFFSYSYPSAETIKNGTCIKLLGRQKYILSLEKTKNPIFAIIYLRDSSGATKTSNIRAVFEDGTVQTGSVNQISLRYSSVQHTSVTFMLYDEGEYYIQLDLRVYANAGAFNSSTDKGRVMLRKAEFSDDTWEEYSATNYDLTRFKADLASIAPIEPTPNLSRAYNKNELLYWMGKLYRTTAPLPTNANISATSLSITATTLSAEIKAIRDALNI